VRHPDGRHIQHDAEMNGQTSLSGVILACRINEEHVGRLPEGRNRLREQWPFTEGQESWLVGGGNGASYNRLLGNIFGLTRQSGSRTLER
jgi:hypothetical protein